MMKKEIIFGLVGSLLIIALMGYYVVQYFDMRSFFPQKIQDVRNNNINIQNNSEGGEDD